MTDMQDFNAGIIKEFRANQGVVGGQFEGAPIVLITTTGAKSGKERINPLVYRAEGDRIFIFASKAGAPTNPDWYHNLKAHPSVTVERGTERYVATAHELDREERDRVYSEHAAANPGFAEYQEQTDRVIPVVELVRD
jgi:deazaflavin-dependent oxidoreductase (nitroreductase family)